LCCSAQHEDDEEPKEDEDMEFSPEKGNVAFASAHDGWAFRVSQFADLYAAKLGFKASALARALWGDYRIDAKSKRIMRIKASQAGKYKPLFIQVSLILRVACRVSVSARHVLFADSSLPRNHHVTCECYLHGIFPTVENDRQIIRKVLHTNIKELV
jgi:hypothetical protein